MTVQATIPELIPQKALREWLELAWVLAERGPAPCEYDPELWWSKTPEDVAAAVAACRRCPAQVACAAYAAAARERHGTWGGLSAAERAR